MVDFEGLHLSAPIAAAVSRLGWTADDPVMRDAAPTAGRGHNLVAILPPVPSAATPALAGMLSRLGGGATGLLLAAETDLDEWAGRIHMVAGEAGLNVLLAHGAGRAARRLRGDRPVDLLVTSPGTALALHGRSALRPETLSSVLLAWPEEWQDEGGLAALMQDLSKDAQRIVLAGSADRSADLVERYARRALTVSAPGLERVIEPAGPVRTVSMPWSRRVGALPELVELLDPASLAVWTLDRGHEPAIRQALAASDSSVQVVTGDAPRVQTVIAFDPPTPTRLRQLAVSGEVVLLTPPPTEAYVRRIASIRRPIRLSGLLEVATTEAEKRRAAIVASIEKGSLDRALFTIAPLLDRYEATAVAAALFDLWSGAPVPAGAPIPDVPTTAKVFVGVGKKDGATVNDIVAVLTKEVRVEREKIGRVELRDGFMLVELPAQDAERVAAALDGTTIRRKRVTARVDGSRKSEGRGSPATGRGPGKSRPSSRGSRP
ncbi:MAG: DbpA RNA binding domain-containing protein [Gemmatimonadales bacterium]